MTRRLKIQLKKQSGTLAVLKFVALFFVLSLNLLHADELHSSQNQLLAAFIFNILKFTSWHGSETNLSKPESKLRIAVIENDSLAEELSRISKNKTVSNHEVSVSKYNYNDIASQLGNIIVLIPQVRRAEPLPLKKLNGCQCLTITYEKGGARNGSIVNFYTEEDRFRFEINLTAAQRENLELSSLLLKLGRIIE